MKFSRTGSDLKSVELCRKRLAPLDAKTSLGAAQALAVGRLGERHHEILAETTELLLHTALLGNAARTAERRAWFSSPGIQRGSMLGLVMRLKSVTAISRLFSSLNHDAIDLHPHFYGTVAHGYL